MKILVSIEVIANNVTPIIAVLYSFKTNYNIDESTKLYLEGYQIPFEALLMFVAINKNKTLKFEIKSDINIIEFFVESIDD